MNPISESPLISVVIVNYNRCDDLRVALLSVAKQDYPHVETIIVDNASTDDSNQMLKDEFPDVRLICLDRNVGMDGYSVGCQAAQGELIFQMDNDSEMPDPTVLSQVAKAFQDGDESLAIVATRVEEFRATGATLDELRVKDLRTGYHKTFGYHAGGVGFRKSLMDTVGWYNEDIFLYGAELFVQMQALAAGFTMRYAPEIFMIHKGSGVARSNFGVYYELRNRYWFMRHFGTTWQCLKFLPRMLLHDAVYSVHRRGIGVGLKAMRDGFRKLPASLHPPRARDNSDFVLAVEATGKSFGLGRTFQRILRRTS